MKLEAFSSSAEGGGQLRPRAHRRHISNGLVLRVQQVCGGVVVERRESRALPSFRLQVQPVRPSALEVLFRPELLEDGEPLLDPLHQVLLHRARRHLLQPLRLRGDVFRALRLPLLDEALLLVVAARAVLNLHPYQVTLLAPGFGQCFGCVGVRGRTAQSVAPPMSVTYASIISSSPSSSHMALSVFLS